MKKFKWLLGLLLLALVPMLQSCDDDGYSIGDFSWDWATVHANGGGSYYLVGDTWGIIDPVATTIPWYRPVDGKRVITLFNPLYDMEGGKGVQVKMEGINELLTKEVEEMKTQEDAEEFGNDPIVISQGYMWLGGRHLNIVFEMQLPRYEPHRISLVQNMLEPTEPGEPETSTEPEASTEQSQPTTFSMDKDGYVNLELRYNTYGDVTDRVGYGRVSYNLEKFYPKDKEAAAKMKGFKIKLHSKTNGEGRVVVLDFDHPVGVPEAAKDAHSTALIR